MTDQQQQFEERTIKVNRVAKVVKGGRRFSFTALMVIGDGKGRVGLGYGKAKEAGLAVQKGIEEARKNMFEVPIAGTTIVHPVIGEAGAGRLEVEWRRQDRRVNGAAGERGVSRSRCADVDVITVAGLQSIGARQLLEIDARDVLLPADHHGLFAQAGPGLDVLLREDFVRPRQIELGDVGENKQPDVKGHGRLVKLSTALIAWCYALKHAAEYPAPRPAFSA